MIPAMVFLLSSLYLEPGHVWTPNWANGNNRTLSPLDIDPYEKPVNVQLSGEGSAYINGNGTMSLTGNAPRYRILENFHNVVVTLYMKRVSEVKELDFAGLVIGTRSHHYTDSLCGANTIYGQINLDGTAKFEKELFHANGRDAFYPDVENAKDQVYAFPDGIPKSWVGIRLIVQNTANNSAVLMQMYVDKNDTGQWEKILQYIDKGDWPVKTTFKNPEKKCDGYYTKNKIITEPGFIFIRNDALGRADYRQFSIREIV
jgi:hypothetical protein